MAMIDTLFKRLDRAMGDYTANVENKKCSSMQTSALYTKDGEEVAGNGGVFAQLEAAIDAFASNLSIPYRECPAEYNNTKGNIQNLLSDIQADYDVFVEQYSRTAILKAVEEAFKEVEEEFNGKVEKYKSLITETNGYFETYRAAEESKKKYESYIANAAVDCPPENIASWKQSIGRAVQHMNSSVKQIETKIYEIESLIKEMKTILEEKGYKKA